MDHSALAVQIPGASGLPVPAAREVQSELIIADGTSLGLAPLLAEAMLPLLQIGGEADPLAAITGELEQRRRSGHLPAVLHLVGHGEPGALHLGRSRIDRQALVNAAPLLARWGTSQIVLWSCEVGADSAFTSTLAELTGAQVLATASQVGVGHQLSFLDANGNMLAFEALFPESAIERWGGTLANVYDAGGKQFDFNFANAELLTPGNSLSINAKWRFRNVVTVKDANGNDVSIDAIVSVLDLVRARLNTLDSSAFQFNTTQIPAANSFLQPIVVFDGTSDPNTVKGGYAEIGIDFVKDFDANVSQGTSVSLLNFKADIYDIDGTGANKSARQYVETNNLEAYAVSAGTLIDISSSPNGTVRFSANNTPAGEGDPQFMFPGYNITGLPGAIVTTPGPEQGFATGDLIRAQLLYDKPVSSLQFRLGESSWAETGPYGAFFALNFGSQIPFQSPPEIIRYSSLGDRIWTDTNVNGQQDDGEAGVAGAVVELFVSVDGQPSGTVLATTLTDSDGNYSFQTLPPGDYIVKFTAPEGARFTLASQGDDASDSDANSSGFTASYTLAPGESNNTIDAGLFTLSSIAGNVYHDANDDGVFDSTESGIGGVTLTLTGVDAFGNAVSLSTTTAENGSYQFADLVPGTYSVTQTQPEGWNDGKDSLGSEGGVLANDLLSGINLLSGVNASNYNFGEVLPTPPPVDPIVAPGVRTPGFWGSCTWSKFWDGVAGNEPKQARTKGFPVGDLQFAPYKSGAQGTQRDPVTGTDRAGLLIGDWNRNGITDAGEQTLFYSTSEALKIINASVKPKTGDMRYTLGRSLNAAWLNYVAGNPVDTAAVGDRDARHWINAGIQWLGTHTPDENGDHFGDGSLTSLARPAIRASSSAWSTPITGGNAIHTSLDRYNNGLGGLADGLFSGG